MIKKIITVIIFMLCLGITVTAQETDFLKEQYELSGADELQQDLPENVREYMAENGINPLEYTNSNRLSAENVFSHIWHFLTTGAKTPLISAGCVLAVILISGVISGSQMGETVSSSVTYATTLSAAAVISGPVLAVISAAVNAMKGCAVFMTSFIPVFAVITASSGAALTSAAMSGLLLTASQVVSWVSGFCVTPLMSGYLSLSVASAVSPTISSSGIANGVKKVAFWIMSLVTTVFVGILSLQTAINSSADNLASRTAKFILGTTVPVAGTALSEALNTVTASMGILKAGVGIYGVIAVAIIFLPLIAELFVWRLCLTINACVSDLFSLKAISSMLRSVDTVMSVLSGIILLTCAMFIISLSVVMSQGN